MSTESRATDRDYLIEKHGTATPEPPAYLDPVRHELHQLRSTIARVEALAAQVDVLYPPKWAFGAEANYVNGYKAARNNLRAILADKEPTP